jgi:large subunit ribosomal protein L30
MLHIKLVKSAIGSCPRNRATLKALGLKKINQVVVKPDNTTFRGMIHNVRHLVSVESRIV